MKLPLKPSLCNTSKIRPLSRTSSGSGSRSNSGSWKNVRFAPQLTTVKSFYSGDEPISISNENSPRLVSVADTVLLDDRDDDGFSVNNNFNYKYYNGDEAFQLDYDSDNESTFEGYYKNLDEKYLGNFHFSLGNTRDNSNANGEGDSAELFADGADEPFEVRDWQLMSSPVQSQFKSEMPFEQLLNGQNIKLYSLKSENDGQAFKLVGLILVNNIQFEKNIEVKFTFNNWENICYQVAYFNRSLNAKFDEFKFTIDLTSFKSLLKLQKILYTKDPVTHCPINIEMCCRYDVNNETYYDNNNYNNYCIPIQATTEVCRLYDASDSSDDTLQGEETMGYNDTDNNASHRTSNFYSDFLISTTMTHRVREASHSRQFSDTTDYYNTSPLKHLYHEDTSLIKPKKLNEVVTEGGEYFGTNLDDAIYADDSINQEEASYYSSSSSADSIDSPSLLNSNSLTSSLSSSLSDMAPLNEYTYLTFGGGSVYSMNTFHDASGDLDGQSVQSDSTEINNNNNTTNSNNNSVETITVKKPTPPAPTLLLPKKERDYQLNNSRFNNSRAYDKFFHTVGNEDETVPENHSMTF
ncbi:hypothetical protein NCAS_0D02530 [Naumovozyma castellii]|uniref:CBM21 domain-containing protein n=1 Tax=Naumovozyma castellii TaxID=27288 RepID=G0VE43_NAUCA|nr:hypothetical protein NCAS_0D02530 [Naumovozyma castellii CBS 4309]CCC69834.1 hypothetical protein NCAS_0D02530 [Naumovozyma castellii CBS 4309]